MMRCSPGALVLLLALLAVCDQTQDKNAQQEHATLQYPDESIAFLSAWVPPLSSGIASRFLVEVSGLLDHVEYVLRVEWAQV